MSTESHGWKQLKVNTKAKFPDLFYHFTSSPRGLVLQLTDVVTLWQCNLSRSEIVSEASTQHCNIDPSESAEQLNVFFTKLEQALGGKENILVRDGDHDNDLRLRTQIALPKPLQPLAFTFQLKVEMVPQFSDAIVRPTLKMLSRVQSQVKSLERQIKAKDHVISKLLDRITQQGIDMSIIFPTLTGIRGRKGNVTVDMAKTRIAGMAIFDKTEWMREFDEPNGPVQEIGELVQGAEKITKTVESGNNWTERLPGLEVLENGKTSQNGRSLTLSRSQSKGEVPGTDEDTASEDEFERQPTPPSMRKRRASPDANNLDEDSSADSDDRPPPTKKQKTGNIEALGKGRTPSKPASKPVLSSSPMSTTQKKSSRVKDDSEVTDNASPASDSDEPEATKKRSQPKSQPASIQSKQKRTSSATSSTTSDSEPPTTTNNSPGKPKPSKLGALRNNKTSTNPSTHSSSPPTHSTPPPPSSPQPRPTSSHSQASAQSHRLGRLSKACQRTTTASPIPEEKGDNNKPPHPAPATPSRRLGRLGVKKPSQSQLQPEVDKATPTMRTADTGSTSDTDTASPSPTSNLILHPSPKSTHNRRNRTASSSTASTNPALRQPNQLSPPAAPPSQPSSPLPQPIETKEQKVIRRKEELAKKIASGPAKQKRRF